MQADEVGEVEARAGGRVIIHHLVKQPCRICKAETLNKKDCPACHAPVLYVEQPKPKKELESNIKARIRKALTSEGVLCWIHNVDNRLLHTGLGLGTADIICVVPPYGRFLGIECKRPGRGKVSDNQTRWLAAVRQFGGVTGIATSVDEALALVRQAQQLSPFDADARQP